MSKSFARVLIVSAYGREHWLAVQLVRLGFDVQLIEVTHKLGKWTPSHYEGPFGIFISPVWTASYIDRLFQERITHEAPNGFSIWLKDGPIELRSPVTTYRLEQLNQKEKILKYVHNHDGYSDSQKKDTANRLENLSFNEKWFAKLAHYLMANKTIPTIVENENYLNRELICPLLDAFFLRRPQESALESSLQWCESQGVVVVRNGEVPDLAIHGSEVEGFEVQSAKSGFVRAHQFIWGLSSLETQYAFPKVFHKIFKDTAVPDYSWQKFKVKLADTPEQKVLPISFLMIENLEFPWVHENFAIVNKNLTDQNSDEFDVWILIPFSQRFQTKYLENTIQKFLNQLFERAPRLKPKLISLPIEAASTSQDLGGIPFPVYDENVLSKTLTKNFSNLHFDNPETWPLLSWHGSYFGQSQIIDHISKWWSNLTPLRKEKELEL